MSNLNELMELREDLTEELKQHPQDIWVKRHLEQVEKQLAELVQDDPATDLSMDSISPPEVQHVPGWQKLELRMNGLPPRWCRNGDPHDGLVVSNARSYGCHLIHNLEESGKLWMTEAAKVAAHYGCSERIIQSAGMRMRNRWYLLPSANFEHRQGDPEYTVSPPNWPYSETEKALWKKMWVKWHFFGVSIWGGTNSVSQLKFNEIYLEDDAGIRKVIHNHFIPTVTNHPWWVMPAMNDWFETGRAKSRIWQVTLNSLFNQDQGIQAKDEFYLDWKDFAPKGMGLREYSETFEPTATAKWPKNIQAKPEEV